MATGEIRGRKTISLNPTICRCWLGISTPITSFPGIGARIRMPKADRARARSSARLTIRLILTPRSRTERESGDHRSRRNLHHLSMDAEILQLLTQKLSLFPLNPHGSSHQQWKRGRTAGPGMGQAESHSVNGGMKGHGFVPLVGVRSVAGKRHLKMGPFPNLLQALLRTKTRSSGKGGIFLSLYFRKNRL